MKTPTSLKLLYGVYFTLAVFFLVLNFFAWYPLILSAWRFYFG